MYVYIYVCVCVCVCVCIFLFTGLHFYFLCVVPWGLLWKRKIGQAILAELGE